jgi:hypothetical protein
MLGKCHTTHTKEAHEVSHVQTAAQAAEEAVLIIPHFLFNKERKREREEKGSVSLLPQLSVLENQLGRRNVEGVWTPLP